MLYFFAVAEAFSRPAIARVEMVAAANVAAVMLAYGLARTFFGAGVGVATGLLYAANPWAVTFGRQPWVITQPLLTTVMLASAMLVVVRQDRRWVIPFFIASAAQTQTHLLAVLYGPPVALTLGLFARRWLTRQTVVGLALSLLVVTPFGLHLWDLRDDIFDALTRGNRGLTLALDRTAATLTVWLVSGYQIEVKLGVPSPILELLRGPLLVLAVTAAILVIAGMVVSTRACWRRREGWQAHALLLVWFLAPLALMSFQSSAVYMHYVLVLLPTPFVLMALGLANLTPRLPSPLGEGGWGVPFVVLALFCMVQIAAVFGFYTALQASLAAPRTAISATEQQAALNRVELGAKQAGIGELHGLPLRYWQSVADRAKEVAASLPAVADGGRGRDIVAVTGIQDDGSRHLDKRRKALDYLLGPELDARFPLEGLVVLPTARDTLFLTIPEQDAPRTTARGATRLAEIPLPGTNSATRVWLVRARPPGDLVQPRSPADALFEVGTRLLGIDAPVRAQPGQSVEVIGYWLVERAEPGSDVEPFLELLDADGRPRAYQARGGLPSSQWRVGDLLIQRGSLTIPVDAEPADYRIAAGLASPDGPRVGRVGAPGTTSAAAASLSVRQRP